jgi:signal transduction histidine kinase/DNA-binding response OmpR family regulator/ligand-binding sensor domain-containing protein
LEQDSKGFVWVGTRNGLARFDGIHFKLFQQSADTGKSSIASNLIINVKKFNNKIWIEHESGEIDQLDPITETVIGNGLPSKYRSRDFLRRAWIANSKGIIWRIVDGAGLIKYGPTPKVYNKKTNGFASDTLWGIAESRNGLLWVLTNCGLSSLDEKSGTVRNYSSAQLPDYHDYRYAVRFPVGLHQRKNGQLMWADRKYLYLFSPQQGKYLKQIPLGSRSDRSVTWIREGSDGSAYFERGGAIYYYNDHDGLALLHGKTQVDKDPIQSFLVDLSGLIWLGTNAHGISQIDLTTPFFPSFRFKEGFVSDVLKTEFNKSLSDLFDWNMQDQRFAAPGYHIRSAYDKNRHLWIGIKQQVVRYNPVTKTFFSLPKLTQISNSSETGIGIKGLTISPGGAPVVIGYNRNILIFSQSKNAWEWLLPEGYISKKLGTNVTPQDVWMDQQHLWITTEMDGLLVIDHKTGKFQQLKQYSSTGPLPSNQLLGVKPDPTRPDLLWIGSRNGLVCLNKKTLKTQIFNTQAGLPDNTIYSLLTDRYGNFWFGTNKGLCRFSPVTHQVQVFQTRHGLLEDEFNRFHQLALPDGRLAFGGTSGWTLFDPDKIKEDTHQPTIALTALKINNETIEQSADGLLISPLNSIKELALPHDQNTVTLYFAGLQFNQPQDLKYRYQLSGYDNGWVHSAHIPFANYTKIPPGTYQFMVNASNTTGHWSKEIKKLTITIRSPWWRSWWAYMLYTTLIVAGVWYWIRLQIIRIDLRKSVELKKREAEHLRTLAEMKERFFTNVTHDFRTPLTLILSPLVQLVEKNAGTDDGAKLQSIERNAEQLLALINQLLDFSRADARMLTVNQSAGDLDHFCKNTITLFREEASKKGVELRLINQVHGNYWFDAAKLERILANLISNGLKFTPAGGQVSLTVTAVQDYIIFSITDTGIGIADDQLAFIFDRYYQVDTNNHTEIAGSGIGLALVKEFVEVQKGYIEVESKYGKGSTFRVFLPYLPAISPTEPVNSDEQRMYSDKNEAVCILLLEDNVELADFIAGSLADHYTIIKAANGADGLKVALEILPDLIISDVMMPVMDGFEFCQQIKKHHQTSHIPVILLTAKVEVESRMQGLSTGADDYLTKPFHVPELNLRVRNLLERQRRMRAHIQNQIGSPGFAPKKDLDPFLTKFYEIIDQDLDNSSVGVDELASRMNMSRSQLHRKLRAVADMTVSDVVRNYRLSKAAEFLKAGFSSSESAYKAGFESPAYFTKCFKAFYGETPSEYNKRTI